MSRQPEGSLCARICKQAEASFRKCKLEKVHGSAFGNMALDLRGSVEGHAIEIEVKMPGKKPTPRQLKRIRDLEALDVITGWVDNVQDAMILIQAGLERRKHGTSNSTTCGK